MDPQHPEPSKLKWHLELTEEDGSDAVVELSILRGEPLRVLSGRVVAYEEDPPFVEEIFLNELLLPKREAQRLLRRLWEDWHGQLLEYSATTVILIIDLDVWVSDRYEGGGRELMAYINTLLRTFAIC